MCCALRLQWTVVQALGQLLPVKSLHYIWSALFKSLTDHSSHPACVCLVVLLLKWCEVWTGVCRLTAARPGSLARTIALRGVHIPNCAFRWRLIPFTSGAHGNTARVSSLHR
jgi:hypothetical protein